MEKLHSQPAWQQIQQEFFATGAAASVLAGLSGLIEQMTIEAFETSFASPSDPSVSLLAVGGFGRRELFPYSDVDVLILIERESQAAALKNALAEFVRLLWDAGLRLSHSVRTVAECAEIHEGNIELSISLLDRRHARRIDRTLRQAWKQVARLFQPAGPGFDPPSMPACARAAREISEYVLSSRAQRERDARRTAGSALDRLAGQIAEAG